MNADAYEDRQARAEDDERRWWAALPPLPDRSHMFPRTLPTPAVCKHCGQPTPDTAARMAHDESCDSRLHPDSY